MDNDFIKSVELIAEFDSYDQFKQSEYSDYEKYPSISVSKLKKIKKSPLHYREEEFETTAAMGFGKAYHAYVLEPERFKEIYHVFDESAILDILKGEGSKKPRGTTKYKDWLEVQYSIAEGKTMLSAEDYKKIESMDKRLKSHRYAKSLLTNGVAEKFLFVNLIDKFGNQYYIKLIADYRKDKKRICTDLKTITCAGEKEVIRDSAKYDYHLQAGIYHDILDHLFGNKLGYKFFFIFQESKKPYAFNIFQASPQFISQGRYEYEMLLMLWKECLKSGKYPGYQVWCENRFGINELSLPPWAISEINYFIH